MKRIFVLLIALFFLATAQTASAAISLSHVQPLPYTYAGNTYTDVAVLYFEGGSSTYIYYYNFPAFSGGSHGGQLWLNGTTLSSGTGNEDVATNALVVGVDQDDSVYVFGGVSQINYSAIGGITDAYINSSRDIFNSDGSAVVKTANIANTPAPTFNFPLSGSLENRTILLGFGDTWTFGECPTGIYKKHAGIDLSATADEEVYAAHDGTVKAIFTGNHAQWADAIIIEDDNQSYTTVYWHVIKYGNLAVNDQVTKGQQIANVADLGGNTHFHFGFRWSSYDSSFSLAGALPEEACGTSPTYPAFPEDFVDPAQLTYE